MNRTVIAAALFLFAGCKGANPAAKAAASYGSDLGRARDAAAQANEAIAASQANKDAVDDAAR